MDGFDATQNVIVLAATNRPDVLDPALLRPGRFDRQVTVDLPDRRGREAILRVHTRAKPLAPDVDLAALAHATPGMSGADLANLANEAAMVAARTNAAQVTQAAFAEAFDRMDAVGPAYLGGSGDDALEGGPFTPWTPRAYSDETARYIDAAIQQLIADAYATARTLLSGNRRTLDALAAALVREESLDSEQLTAIVSTADSRA